MHQHPRDTFAPTPRSTNTRYIREPDGGEHVSHLLIPYATLLPHIHPAVSTQPSDNVDYISLFPSGSRMPVVGFDGPDASVYMFDLNPFAARYTRTRCDDSGSWSDTAEEATAIVADVEAALPGVVNPECAAIPYIVYRFRLPRLPSGLDHDAIRAVRMSMAGFTVTISFLSHSQSAPPLADRASTE